MATKKSAVPARIQPQLVALVTRPPAGDWAYEIKFDGYRMFARIDAGVALFTKNGYDWTKRMPRLAQDLQSLPIRGAWLDGEVVVQDDDDRPAFQSLQEAFAIGDTDRLIYFAFDLLFIDGVDLRPRPVEQRRNLLRVLLEQVDLDQVRFSETLEADPAHLLASACALGIEGIVGKRLGSTYAGERDGSWIKLKCVQRQEFVILGYTRSSAGIGSLLIGLHDDAGQLQYAGRVRSGFTGRELDRLKNRLGPLVRRTSALRTPPKLQGGVVVWVEPQLVCEVKFAELTPAGKVRHAVYIALRDDKPASAISLESDTDPV
ncbi:non-homologous end-joining DNA ligase [Pseudomonas juntendi]|jgi:bifunctional non-homologous end joining protein LigD|uniref:non-homologous end-joining DNA ligase n=1 Tax=Pseudomonas TaxID=286 RepID=UPI00067CA95E|nr:MULTISPECIES: non-homologous end-joining DNA ligase [Pseudomonas]UQB76475.1 non-homologous end-joining DNA ligase [Pseudomonas shirazica]EKT4504576.1 non-homologous end-joining DNA ligase [Pseudomonas putida]ELL4316904.1 non-homologous end-joining DNA ligase [Pseudomonas aeruginosa]ELR9620093.1 non-homologous end-joining DNA ligase [Pseudomonas aeruginosa]MBZ3666376.1 non-homologous end-joining DNA ligase [Pseudomonas monteilii]